MSKLSIEEENVIKEAIQGVSQKLVVTYGEIAEAAKSLDAVRIKTQQMIKKSPGEKK